MGLDNRVYLEPTDQAWQEAWRVTEGLLELMHQDVREKGATFVVVTLSNSIQVNPDPQARQEFVSALAVNDLFYPERRIQAVGDRAGFLVLNLAPVMQEYAERNQVYLHGFPESGLGSGHRNPAGHHLAGGLIAQALCRHLAEHP